MAKVRSSVNFWVVVFKACLLWYMGGTLAKVGSSVIFCVVVFKASLLWYCGVYWLKSVCLSSVVYWYSRHLCSGTGEGAIGKSRVICQFCVVVFKASLLWYLGGGGSIGQSRVICKVLCSGIQGMTALVPGGSIDQSRVICQLLCSGIQGMTALVLGSLLTKVGSSAKICVVVCKSSLTQYLGGS